MRGERGTYCSMAAFGSEEEASRYPRQTYLGVGDGGRWWEMMGDGGRCPRQTYLGWEMVGGGGR